ncbi:hypothetical protein L2E82_48198 [Cichorium intybus]|uniref:Uncharacterized protein n=1 Tax=Cichorium intybus TaxID=13427 RepID=A0ACB8YY58_CICIN|nr:hypothetical protein L2E82_48198 [Cichorium intybus]
MRASQNATSNSIGTIYVFNAFLITNLSFFSPIATQSDPLHPLSHLVASANQERRSTAGSTSGRGKRRSRRNVAEIILYRSPVGNGDCHVSCYLG